MLWPKRRTALSTLWAMDAVNPPQSTFHTSATGGPYTARWTSWKTWAPGPAYRRADVRRGRKSPVGDAGLVKRSDPWPEIA